MPPEGYFPAVAPTIQPIKIQTPAEAQEIVLKQEEARAKARALIDTAKDNADITRAMQSNIGPDGMPDFHGALQSLSATNPRAHVTLQKLVTDLQDKAAKAHDQELKNADLQAQQIARTWQGVVGANGEIDPVKYGAAYRDSVALDPSFAQVMRPAPDQNSAQLIGHLVDSGTQVPEYNKVEAEKAKNLREHADEKGLIEYLALANPNDPKDYQNRLDYAQLQGTPKTVIDLWRGRTVADAKQATISPKDQAELADKAAGRQQTIVNEAALRAQAAAAFAETQRHNRVMEGLGARREGRLEGGGTQGPTLQGSIDPNAPHGADYLKTIPKDAAMVKALAEGKQPWPSAMALRTPYWQDLMNKVFQYDPTFDTAQASNNARVKTRIDFTSGATSKNINALNTAIKHMGTLEAIGDQLGNTKYDFVNTVRNWLTPGGSARGQAINNFGLAVDAVAGELTRVYRQTGGNEADIQSWKAKMNAAKSPQELQGAYATLGDLLEGKISQFQEQADRGLGIGTIQVLSPEVRANLNRLTGGGGATGAKSYTGEVRRTADGRTLGLVNGQPVEVVKSGNGWVVK